ncbi:ParA family protein [Actinomycetospora endophytica]|uniref:ParA family protein n=1 Tax=Actinomycetospora endophytica TaxID=2291215 RepID=A0ABS8P538_9PSEU|nr:ParA family protein [Actinomycetospora endophytica]MCD2192174.1 ParA family protein [Actinomycetospora endophytica]
MRVAVANNKGGAGKTTAIVHLAEALAARGRRVLAVDLDPQANLSRRLGYGEAELASMVTAAEVVAAHQKGCAADAIVGCRWITAGAERIDLLPARYDLEARVAEAGQLGSHERLEVALVGVAEDYDVVLLDCPPSLGHLTQLGLAAADTVVLVLRPEYDHLQGAIRVRDFVTTYRRHLGRPRLDVAGVIINEHDRRRGLHAWHTDSVTETFGPLVWSPPIPSRAVLAEAIDAAQPLRARGAPARALIATFSTLADQLEAATDALA